MTRHLLGIAGDDADRDTILGEAGDGTRRIGKGPLGDARYGPPPPLAGGSWGGGTQKNLERLRAVPMLAGPPPSSSRWSGGACARSPRPPIAFKASWGRRARWKGAGRGEPLPPGPGKASKLTISRQ